MNDIIIPAITTFLLAITMLYDIYTTKRAVIDNPLKYEEQNMLVKGVVKRYGVMGMLVVKAVVFIPLAIIIWYFRSWAAYGPALAAAIATGFIAWRNRRLFKRA